MSHLRLKSVVHPLVESPEGLPFAPLRGETFKVPVSPTPALALPVPHSYLARKT